MKPKLKDILRHSILLVYLIWSIVLCVKQSRQLFGWEDYVRYNSGNPYTGVAGMLMSILWVLSPLVLIMVWRRAILFAYVYALIGLHWICWYSFWWWIAPPPTTMPDTSFGVVSSMLLIGFFSIAPFPYFVRTCIPKHKFLEVLRSWKSIASFALVVSLVMYSSFWLSLDESYFTRNMVWRAERAFAKKDADKSMQLCNSALARDHEYARAYLVRAMIHDFKGNHDTAIRDLDTVLNLLPTTDKAYRAYAYYRRGRIEEGRQNYHAATNDFTKALVASKDRRYTIVPWIYYFRGAVRAKLNDMRGAEADFRAALETAFTDYGPHDEIKRLANAGLNTLAHEDQGQPIHEAARKGNLADVKRHLEKGAKVDARGKRGNTPLMEAGFAGHLDVVKFLAEKGANLNARGYLDKTPLMLAAAAGNPDIVKYLLEKDADVNAKDKRCWTPLMYAVGGGHLDAAKFLVEKGAEVNARDEWDITPLMEAGSRSQLDVVKYLVAKGADVNAKDKKGRTPLMWAAEEGRTNVVEYLKQQGAKK